MEGQETELCADMSAKRALSKRKLNIKGLSEGETQEYRIKRNKLQK